MYLTDSGCLSGVGKGSFDPKQPLAEDKEALNKVWIGILQGVREKRGRFRPDFIEHQLAHTVRDPLWRAYNRTSHLEERKEMMQAWADYLDSLRLA